MCEDSPRSVASTSLRLGAERLQASNHRRHSGTEGQPARPAAPAGAVTTPEVLRRPESVRPARTSPHPRSAGVQARRPPDQALLRARRAVDDDRGRRRRNRLAFAGALEIGQERSAGLIAGHRLRLQAARDHRIHASGIVGSIDRSDGGALLHARHQLGDGGGRMRLPAGRAACRRGSARTRRCRRADRPLALAPARAPCTRPCRRLRRDAVMPATVPSRSSIARCRSP